MSKSNPKILVLFYSMYGHVFKMTEAARKGVLQSGVEPIQIIKLCRAKVII